MKLAVKDVLAGAVGLALTVGLLSGCSAKSDAASRDRISKASQRVDAAAKEIDVAAAKCEGACNAAAVAAQRATESAQRADAAAQKVEDLYMRRMSK